MRKPKHQPTRNNSILAIYRRRTRGFTLIEIVIASVLFTVATAGLFASFIAAKKSVVRSRHRLAAANAARIVLEDFKNYVDQRTWNDPGNNPLAKTCTVLAPCLYTNLPAEFIGTPFNWSARYVVTPIDVNGIIMLRVDVTIHWDEPTN